MAFSFSAGTNWCHDFPKLAKESGFHFNMHRSHVRVDWNRISTIDIDRVIRERDFTTIDDNINSVVDYHLETEYDIKILDSNFVKLFRLAQLSVEYLLYCKQYLDHSVIILKDELRSKLEENVKLKKKLSTFEDNMQEMRGKFRDNYRFIEKRFSDSHGEIHKCPFCPKTFMADVFMNAHVSRRHANTSQLPMVSPVHEQYKAQAEKLQNEIKALKERLNETERVVRSESVKICHYVGLDKDKYDDLKNGKLLDNASVSDRRLEEEHKRYREEINHLTTMLFSEIQSLKQNENKSANHNESGNENMKELLKQQENEINQMRDQLQQLSLNRSTPDMEIIQAKLNAQENYWRTKLELLESQHRHDIEILYRQMKITRTSADYVDADYSKKVGKSEISSIYEAELLADFKPSVKKFGKSPDQIISLHRAEGTVNNRGIYGESTKNAGINRDNCNEILIEDLDKISDIDTMTTDTIVDKFHSITLSTVNPDDYPVGIGNRKDNIRKNIHTLKPRCNSFEKSSNRRNKIDSHHPLVSLKITPSKRIPHPNANTINYRKSVIAARHADEIDVSPIESDKTDSNSESTSNSKSTESEKMSGLENVNCTVSSEGEKAQESEHSQTNERPKNEEELKIEIQETLEQKLRDLGVDPQWQQIPTATYRQLIDTVKYHRSINSKKYFEFENLRRDIIEQIADSVSKYIEDNDIPSGLDTGNLIINKKFESFEVPGTQCYYNSHIPKIKSHICSSNDKSITNKLNIELLPRMVDSSQLQKSQLNRDNNDLLSSSINDRYTLSPSILTTKSMDSMNMKHLSHSYESMKDNNCSYRKIDSSLNMNGPITTSTPQRDDVNISSNHKAIALEASSQPLNTEEIVNPFNSPKHNKSVLKSTTGSIGSLVKKKVLFDLQTTESPRNTIESHDFQTLIVDNKIGSESDSEVSNDCEGQSNGLQISSTTNADKIVLKTSQCEKIAEITRKIEIQLNAIRHKPSGGIEAMFMKGLHNGIEPQIEGEPLDNPLCPSENNIKVVGTSEPFLKLPEPASRTSRSIHHSVLSDCKFDMKDSNLDIDIEEILQEN